VLLPVGTVTVMFPVVVETGMTVTVMLLAAVVVSEPLPVLVLTVLVVRVDVLSPVIGLVTGGHRVGKVFRVLDKVDVVEKVVVDVDSVVVFSELGVGDSVTVVFSELGVGDSVTVVFSELGVGDSVTVVFSELGVGDSVTVVFSKLDVLDSFETAAAITSTQVWITLPASVVLHANGYSSLHASIQYDPSHDGASAEPSDTGVHPAPSQQKHEQIALPFVVATYIAANMPTSRTIYFDILDLFIISKDKSPVFSYR
jgi:hypothetical protein